MKTERVPTVAATNPKRFNDKRVTKMPIPGTTVVVEHNKVIRQTLALCLVLLVGCGENGSPGGPSGSLFERSGTGNETFDMPTDVERVRITAVFLGTRATFVVRVADDLIVDEELGSLLGRPSYDETHEVDGGQVQVETPVTIEWTMTEVR